jgi:hypothetical protein
VLFAVPVDPPPVAPVAVVDRSVTLREHDRVRLRVSCRRTHRRCVGELVLGSGFCDMHPVGPDCQIVIGRGRFDIPPGRHRAVTVRRVPGAQANSSRPDVLPVSATPYLHPTRNPRRGSRTRGVLLRAPAGLARPAVGPAVTKVATSWGLRALLAHAHVPLGTTGARVELPGSTIALHQSMYSGYVTHESSFAVGAAYWHGQEPLGPASPRPGQQLASRLVACAAGVCGTADRTLSVSDGDYMGPICRLPANPGPES